VYAVVAVTQLDGADLRHLVVGDADDHVALLRGEPEQNEPPAPFAGVGDPDEENDDAQRHRRG